MNDPTSFWQYSGSVGVFSSRHGFGGDGLGGEGEGGGDGWSPTQSQPEQSQPTPERTAQLKLCLVQTSSQLIPRATDGVHTSAGEGDGGGGGEGKGEGGDGEGGSGGEVTSRRQKPQVCSQAAM